MIGIFDSGVGGKIILEELEKKLPQYKYLFLSDAENAPYGNKSPDEIFELTKAGATKLFEQKCSLVILGCNTASTVLRRLQREWLPSAYPDKKLLGIVVPTVEQITGADWKHDKPITTNASTQKINVGVLATPLTIKSGVYEKEITKRNPSINVISQACPNLAHLIESKNDTSEEIENCVEKLLKQTKGDLNAVLLGCTHYELVADAIKQEIPQTTKLYHQPSIVAASLMDYLNRHPEIDI